jgi:hypothetical protein
MPMDERKAWINKDGTFSLECSTKGDIRFSAFGAKLELFGINATIEQHYQLSKRFMNKGGQVFTPKSIYDVKGKNSKVTGMEMCWLDIYNRILPIEYRVEFYKMMWLMYLDLNPGLVEFAKQFDDFSDIFKGKGIICQADCIRQYIKDGRDSIIEEILPFTDLLDIDRGLIYLGVWE